jgi:hypothetical protein
MGTSPSSSFSPPTSSTLLGLVDPSWKPDDVHKEDIVLPNGNKKLAFGMHVVYSCCRGWERFIAV